MNTIATVSKRRMLEAPHLSVKQRSFLQAHRTEQKRIRFWQWFIFFAFLAFWEIGAQIGFINAFVFSSPTRLVRCAASMFAEQRLLYHIGITLFETFVSFLLIILIGLLVAVLLWWNRKLAKIFDPYLVILNSLPKSALAPAFIIWLGSNQKTIIVAAVSVAVFGTIITLYTDFNHTEEDKIKLIYTLGGAKRDVLCKVVLPGNIPSILSCMKVNIGLSLVGVIIAEFIAAKAGLGYLIIYGSQVFKLDWVILSIVILCFIATGLYHLLSFVERKALK